MRRAKIVCTLGPATTSYEQIRDLVAAGMDVARFNMSHGAYPEHEERYHRVRQAGDECGRAVGVLMDLQGPKIRTGTFRDGPVELAVGDTFTITTRDVPGDRGTVGTTYAGLPGDVEVGDLLLVDDGKVALRATAVTPTDVETVVTVPGTISDHKGINLPGVAVSVPALSEKDEQDLRWALRLGADMIALSFVRDAQDANRVREIMAEEGVTRPVIAKIEKPQAVANLVEIIAAFDGIMVARGDLGVELPLEEVPIVQKHAIDLARRAAKPVIVATQVLESMITNPRPTRAEASDCANAVLDGADAIMLSGETSVGRYPHLAVDTMARIIAKSESEGMARIQPLRTRPSTVGGAITAAAAEVGELVGAKYLVAFTQSGGSARRMSRIRPRLPMLAFTPVPLTRSQLALSWGFETFLIGDAQHTDNLVEQLDEALLESGRCGPGDVVVFVAGSPPGIPGRTNSVRVHRVGERD